MSTAQRPSLTPMRTGILHRTCACADHTNGAHCIECTQKRSLLQRETTRDYARKEAPPVVHKVLGSPGQPLDAATRAFFEPRFRRDFTQVPLHAAGSGSAEPEIGQPDSVWEQEAEQVAESISGKSGAAGTLPPARRDFSQVRVHTDARAAAAARAISSEAFTAGNHIVFDQGRYAPQTAAGKHLLAHELTHVTQQSGPSLIQRTLAVNPSHPAFAPSTDPAAALTPAQRFSMMDSLIQGLCDRFEVDSVGGEVLTKSRTSLDPAALVTGSKPTGCCCLNVLTNAPNTWTIQVSQVIGARTLFGTRDVILNPTTSPVEFGAFTAADTLAFQGAVPTAGHELCGHAALEELQAHPAGQDRMTTDVHDPTVRIENLVSTEQGIPASELRGLAASGSHRGESVDRITIGNYPLNGTNVPSSESAKLQFAVDYAQTNDSFVSILGHSDAAGSSAAKQAVSDLRANKAKTALIAKGLSQITGASNPMPGVNRFATVKGVSDSQPPTPPLDAVQANWRRVEIHTASFPAGALTPPTGTPTAVTPHTQSPNVTPLKGSPDQCVRHLVRGAYP